MACGNDDKDLTITDEVNQLKDVYLEQGIPGVAEEMQKKLDGWKQIPLKIAVTGRSGTGKSSFINSLRGITADDTDQEPARVGVVEMTQEVRGYKYPGNDKFIIFDTPGLGTPTFKRDTYMSDIKADEYDIFIIITKDRFFDDDIWLARELCNIKKKFYFVRSNIASDIENHRMSHPRSHNDIEVIASIKANISGSLKEFAGVEVYLIDNYEPDSYDFDDLKKRMTDDSDDMKKEALVFSFACLSERVIQEKKERLSRRIPRVALKCSLFIKTNYYFDIKSEILFYEKQFGIDSEGLKRGSEVSQMSESFFDTQSAEVFHQRVELLDDVEELLTQFITIIPGYSNIKTFKTVCKALKQALDTISDKAKDNHRTLYKGLVKSTFDT